MQPEEDSRFADRQPDCGASSLVGAADSSNRPWETGSLRIAPADPKPALAGLAIAAAALLALAVVALADAPGGSGSAPGGPAEAARGRLLLGHYLGVLLLPAYAAGYWLALRGLRPAGAWLSWPVFLLGSYAAAVAGARHGLIAVEALIARHGAIDPAGAERLVAAARGFTDPLEAAAATLFVAASLWFAAAAASGRSRYPRWMALANPLVLAMLFAAPRLLAPASPAALLAAAAGAHLGHLLFFVLLALAPARRPATT